MIWPDGIDVSESISIDYYIMVGFVSDLVRCFFSSPRLSISFVAAPRSGSASTKCPVATVKNCAGTARRARLPTNSKWKHTARGASLCHPRMLEPCQRSYGVEEYSNLLPPFIPLMNYVYCRILCDTLCPAICTREFSAYANASHIWQDNNCVNFIHFVAQTYELMTRVSEGDGSRPDQFVCVYWNFRFKWAMMHILVSY